MLLTILLFIVGMSPPTGGHSIGASLGSVRGVVIDAATGEPIPYVYLHLEEVAKTTTSDREGRFDFGAIGSGTFTLALHHIGYEDVHFTVKISEDQSLNLTLKMNPAFLRGEELVVSGQSIESAGHLDEVSAKISGSELRASKGQTLSETLLRMPGFDQRSMGVAPSRPVIRGLGGERVMILKDGQSTGDVSSQSGDHAVTLDPISADEIEIARGPAALAYGANAIGGIVNVVQNQIPTTIPSSFTGSFDLQAVSVSRGSAGALKFSIPAGSRWAVSGDVNGRFGSDLSSPDGRIENSWIRSGTVNLGAGRMGERGSVGVGGSFYMNQYGIPPDTLGGHPEGVDIEMYNFGFLSRFDYRPRSPWLQHIEGTAGVHQYNHKELEASGSIGTEYGQVTWNTNLRFRHKPITEGNSGSFGVWGEVRDYAVFGTQTPDVLAGSVAGYWIESFEIGGFKRQAGHFDHASGFSSGVTDHPPLRLDFGLRYTLNRTKPEQERLTSPIGAIRARTFTGLASSASLTWTGFKDLAIGVSALHSYRPPSIEEIYSLGPHLAAYTYELGNPRLDPERAVAGEVFVSVEKTRVQIRLNGYVTQFSNYIYPRNTGELNQRFPTLYNYKFAGTKAIMRGGEVDLSFLPVSSLQINVQGSLTYADRDRDLLDSEEGESRVPLPLIPPAKSRFGIVWAHKTITLQGWMNVAATQNRLGEFESSTDGYVTLDLVAQYRFMKWPLLHTVSLNIQNLTDARYRDHLSLIKEIRPEPGIRGSVLYKVYF